MALLPTGTIVKDIEHGIFISNNGSFVVVGSKSYITVFSRNETDGRLTREQVVNEPNTPKFYSITGHGNYLYASASQTKAISVFGFGGSQKHCNEWQTQPVVAEVCPRTTTPPKSRAGGQSPPSQSSEGHIVTIILITISLLLVVAAAKTFAIVRKSSSKNAKLAPSDKPKGSQKTSLKKKVKKEEAKKEVERPAMPIFPQATVKTRIESVVRSSNFQPSSSFVRATDGTQIFTIPEKYKCLCIPSDKLLQEGEIGAGSFALVGVLSLVQHFVVEPDYLPSFFAAGPCTRPRSLAGPGSLHGKLYTSNRVRVTSLWARSSFSQHCLIHVSFQLREKILRIT